MIFLTMTPNGPNGTCRRVGASVILAFSLMFMMAKRRFRSVGAPAGSGLLLWTLPARTRCRYAEAGYRRAAGHAGQWLTARDFEISFRENLRRVYSYRKQVLAIFDGLISNEQMRPRLQ